MYILKRDFYLEKIKPLINKDIIKVLTGIRRSGKSIILKLIIEELKNNGIKENNIVYMNFDSPQFQKINTMEKLNEYIIKIFENKQDKVYLFFDEIQNVTGWQRSVNGFMLEYNCDIYITSSNSKLLSGELSTYLTGRYMEIPIYPFSFKEILQYYQINNQSINEWEIFNEYVSFGGFPILFTLNKDYKLDYLEDLYNSILLKDVVTKYNIKNPKVLNKLIHYISLNIGHTFSGNSISKYLKNEGITISPNTLYNYLNYCENACLIHKVKREDIISKKVLKTNEKYYLTDHGFRQALCLCNNQDLGQVFENIIYIEMLRRGYKVTIGKTQNKEIDFICKKHGEKIYIQVAYMLTDKKTQEREFNELLKIEDNYPKIVISADQFDFSQKGIKHYNIIDFLKQ